MPTQYAALPQICSAMQLLMTWVTCPLSLLLGFPFSSQRWALDRQKNSQTDGQTYTQTDRQTEGQTDGRTDEQRDGHIDEQIDRRTGVTRTADP